MDFFNVLLDNFWFEAIIRLILGFVLAGIIGAERQSVNKPAGFKTHSLIGVSSVLIMLCGEYLSTVYAGADASRIPAQLLSGIGFIGAGTILRDGFNVKGLTTAASLLAVTCIGLSIGAGFYLGGIITTIIVYIILSYSHTMFDSLDHFNNVELNLVVKHFEETMPLIQKVLDKHEISIKKIKNSQSDEEKTRDVQIMFRHNRSENINSILTEISKLENVIDLEQT
ncbi:MAG: MgtC/SapB family protein [Clostridia bacterium]|nr:MgtC/SapB family protein [Clostridia bacterium]